MEGATSGFCVFVYAVGTQTEPASQRAAMAFREIYLGRVETSDFKVYERGALGTRTSSLSADAMSEFRRKWIYLDVPPVSTRKVAKRGSAA